MFYLVTVVSILRWRWRPSIHNVQMIRAGLQRISLEPSTESRFRNDAFVNLPRDEINNPCSSIGSSLQLSNNEWIKTFTCQGLALTLNGFAKFRHKLEQDVVVNIGSTVESLFEEFSVQHLGMIYYSYALLNIPSTFVERLSSKLLSRLLRVS